VYVYGERRITLKEKATAATTTVHPVPLKLAKKYPPLPLISDSAAISAGEVLRVDAGFPILVYWARKKLND
jgi:hypothetical protein